MVATVFTKTSISNNAGNVLERYVLRKDFTSIFQNCFVTIQIINAIYIKHFPGNLVVCTDIFRTLEIKTRGKQQV